MSIAFVVTAPAPASAIARSGSVVVLDRTDEVEPPLSSAVAEMMGGRVGVYLRPVDGGMTATSEADRAARSILRRVAAWAARLTRFSTTSDLARLNGAVMSSVPIRPTLAAVLDWARMAEGMSDGIVDVAMLDARLAAEGIEGATTDAAQVDHSWSMDRGSRRTHVRRPTGLRLDLDGVAKGWLADRALGRLDPFPAAVVDADGDVAIRLGRGQRWRVGIADPRTAGEHLVQLDLVGSDRHGGRRFGVATSGTSVHRWVHDGGVSHHLIDPRTAMPARTDIVQATVLARTAREAETLAKAAVILGSDAALELLGGPGVDGAILLTQGDELLLTPSTMRFLA